MVDRALLFRALHAHFVGFYVLCFVGKVYPWPRIGLLSLGEAFGMSRPNTLACGLRKRPGSFLIGSHYRDSQYTMATMDAGELRERRSPRVTFNDAPQPPETLRLTLGQKSMWDYCVETCKGMSPAKLLEYFNSEKKRITEAVKERGSITHEEADFLNRMTRDNITEMLDNFKEEVLVQMKVSPKVHT